MSANLLSQDDYLIMTKENMSKSSRYGQRYFCAVGKCEIEIGRNIEHYIISGNILHMEGLYLPTSNCMKPILKPARCQEIKNHSLVDLISDIQNGSAKLLQQGLHISLPPITTSKTEVIEKHLL